MNSRRQMRGARGWTATCDVMTRKAGGRDFVAAWASHEQFPVMIYEERKRMGQRGLVLKFGQNLPIFLLSG